MALKLRRGTNAERLTVTPEQGELIYTTDTKRLFVGDGSTAGGTVVTGINDIVDDTSPQLGGNLDLNGNDITGTGNINITGTVTATGNINLGDGAGGDVITIGGSIDGSLIPDEDLSYSIGSITKRFLNVHAIQADIQGSITADAISADVLADDSTVIIDSTTLNITGNNFTGTLFTGDTVGSHTGSVDGDVIGSVFGDDSTPLVDAIANEIVGNVRTPNLIVDGLLGQAASTKLNYDANDAVGSTLLGEIIFQEQQQSKGFIQGRRDSIYISTEEVGGTTGITVNDDLTVFGGQHVRINPSNTIFSKPTDALQVDGDATITGTISSSFVGSLASDNSTMVVDNNGTIVNLAFTGEVGNTPADTGTVDSWLEVSVNGATKYIPLYA